MERLNQVTLIGNIGMVSKKDTHTYFSLALDDSYKKKDSNEWVNRVIWVNCSTFFKGTIEKIEKVGLAVGDAVLVTGRLAQMKSKEGQLSLSVTVDKVVVLKKKVSSETKPSDEAEEQLEPETTVTPDPDELPF
jgi:single-stranded DNA-binding protein